MNHSGYVQYGCGICAPMGWRNFDVSPVLRLQRLPLMGRLFRGGAFPDFPPNVEYGDVVKGLPVPPSSCKGIYCSHVLEHLSLNDFREALRNTRSSLGKGGIFRLVVPDLEFFIQSYVKSQAPGAALQFMEDTFLGKKNRSRSLSGFLRDWMGNSQHLWMWDFKSLSQELELTGFKKIRRAKFSDSADPRFKEVEDAGRWNNCLGMECQKDE